MALLRYLLRQIRFCAMPGAERNRGQLQLRVNAEQRAVRWRSRTEIADEAVFGAKFHVASLPTARAIDKHRSHRCLEWVAHRKLLESVSADQFLASVFREHARRPRINRASGNQSLFHVMPAPRTRVCARAFLRDGRGPAQLRIDARINLRERINDLPRLIFRDDLGRLFMSESVLEKECPLRILS